MQLVKQAWLRAGLGSSQRCSSCRGARESNTGGEEKQYHAGCVLSQGAVGQLSSKELVLVTHILKSLRQSLLYKAVGHQ
jgi:hypothetical protein